MLPPPCLTAVTVVLGLKVSHLHFQKYHQTFIHTFPARGRLEPWWFLKIIYSHFMMVKWNCQVIKGVCCIPPWKRDYFQFTYRSARPRWKNLSLLCFVQSSVTLIFMLSHISKHTPTTCLWFFFVFVCLFCFFRQNPFFKLISSFLKCCRL